MNSNTLSTRFQTQFISNSYKNSFNSSPSPHLCFDYPRTNFKNPLISIRKHPPKVVATNHAFCTPEETLYDLLAIPQSGTLFEIKRAYKQMALKYHPDVSPPDQVHEYTVRFIRLQEAYETLSDPDSRAAYDSNLARGLHLAISVKKGLRWNNKQSWEEQLEELIKQRSTVETERAGCGGRMPWAARIGKRSQTNQSV